VAPISLTVRSISNLCASSLRRGNPLHAPLRHQRAERCGLQRLVKELHVLGAGLVAHRRRAVGGDQNRRQLGAEALPQLGDGGETGAAVEVAALTLFCFLDFRHGELPACDIGRARCGC
jgi:hypothetical protein